MSKLSTPDPHFCETAQPDYDQRSPRNGRRVVTVVQPTHRTISHLWMPVRCAAIRAAVAWGVVVVMRRF